MSHIITFLSIDPSLANTAAVLGTYNTDTKEINIEESFLFQTEKTKAKQVRASSDLIERCKHLNNSIHEVLIKKHVDVIFAETPSGSQSADGMKNYGVSCMLLATLIPEPIQVTPIEVKVKSVNNKKASKQDMIDWAYALYPYKHLWHFHSGKLTLKNEHIADAIAVVHAGITTPQFSQVTAFLKNYKAQQ